MVNLGITNPEDWNELANLAVKDLLKNYSGNEATDKTKRSVTILSIFKGMYQAEAHREGIQYQIIRDISKDKEQLKKYIEASMPQLNPVLKLEKKRG